MILPCKNLREHTTVVGNEFVPSDVPPPWARERPTIYADRVGEWYTARKSDRHRKDHGLFFSPVAVAKFIAGQIEVNGPNLRVLDPAAGVGILCCAAVEAIISRGKRPDTLQVVAYELEVDLIAPLRAVLDHLTDWCRDFGFTLTVIIKPIDFILANAGVLRGGIVSLRPTTGNFDIVIANPPYFKIAKSDPRAVAVSEVVHGQPNIYALFMAVGAAMLCSGGDFVFITPRSFASGLYFRRFRGFFFGIIRLTGIHIFCSRRDTFCRDNVLQENIIVRGIREDTRHKNRGAGQLDISSSRGVHDIGTSTRRKVSINTVLDFASPDKVLRLPVGDEDDEVLALVDSWPGSLRRFGLNISTGPVVPFRATRVVAPEGEVPTSHVPLLWMNHVRAMRVTWPLDRHKPEYIKRFGAETLLIPNRNYVLLRRFSTKEEARRLTAAPWLVVESTIPEIGFENHLNYVHRPGGTLSEDETWGLAALYNCRLLDVWFRAVNGNTQVSATELRSMPLPALDTIVALGGRVKHLADPMTELDALVTAMFTPASIKETTVR